MQRSFPLASAGLRRFEASMVPPQVAPAPTMVWISSMKRIASGSFSSALSTALRRSSNSPRNLRAGEQRAHVERVDRRVLEELRAPRRWWMRERQALDDGGLADARVADEERVVLAAPAEHVDRALELVLAADQRVDVARRPRAR